LRTVAAKQSCTRREQCRAARADRVRIALFVEQRRPALGDPRQVGAAYPARQQLGRGRLQPWLGRRRALSSRSSASRHHASRIAPNAGWVELATTSPSASSIANRASNAGRNSTGQ
jgi:hypothetical protein